MKLTKETLKQIIKEELEATMEEGFFSDMFFGKPTIGFSEGEELGRQHGRKGMPKKSDEEIVKMGEKEGYRLDRESFLSGYEHGHMVAYGAFEREQRRSEPQSQYIGGDAFDEDEYSYEAYRQAMNRDLAGSSWKPKASDDDYRKGSPRTRGRS